MPKLEQLQKPHHKRAVEEAASTFPESFSTVRAHGGNPDTDEDILKSIDVVIIDHERLMHELGQRGIERSE